MTLQDYWNENDITSIFLVGVGCPGGLEITDTTGEEGVSDEDYCNLLDCLQEGLIGGSPHYDDLEGTVSKDGSVWEWDGEGTPRDLRGNDYQRIQLRREN